MSSARIADWGSALQRWRAARQCRYAWWQHILLMAELLAGGGLRGVLHPPEGCARMPPEVLRGLTSNSKNPGPMAILDEARNATGGARELPPHLPRVPQTPRRALVRPGISPSGRSPQVRRRSGGAPATSAAAALHHRHRPAGVTGNHWSF